MEEVFNKNQLEKINKKIQELNVATDLGRIGSNISSNYGTFTAQEWKNWTTVHSMHVLCGILPNEQLKVWEMFVQASRILCQQVLTSIDVKKADLLLLNFCKGFARIYGNEAVTPNMHLSCHLIDCLLDYGPVYGFWLFSFERYNDELGSFVTNNRSVEIQFMRTFVTSSFVNPINGNVPSLYKNDFEDLFCKNKPKEVESSLNPLSLYLASSTKDAESVKWSAISYLKLSEFVEDTLDNDDMLALLHVYGIMYPGQSSFTVDNTSSLITKYKYVCVGQEKYGSRADCRSNRSARILARWVTDNNQVSMEEVNLQPGLVSNYFSHNLWLNGVSTSHLFAVVRWRKKAPSNGNCRELWFDMQFENGGGTSFLPIQRIHSRLATGFLKTPSHRYFAACPLPRKIVF